MAEKKHLVMPRETNVTHVETSKGKIKLNPHGTLVDESIANEIEHNQGLKGTGDVWTHEDARGNHVARYKPDGLHSYFFGSTPSFADAWEAFEKRRKDRKREDRGQKAEVK